MVPVLLFVESFLEKNLDCMVEVFFARTILFGSNHRGINQFWIELMDNLLSDTLVLALEHVLELQKGVSQVKMDFLGPLVKIGDSIVNSELNTKFVTVLVDFGFHLVARVIALQLLSLWKRRFLIPGLQEKIMGRFLID